jgi:sec-independent protein translocase protein TatB
MLDLSWSHIFIILVVALIVVGPKDLPRMMHTLGRWMGKARAMADQFRKSFDEMARQAELDELRSEIDALRRERPFAGLDQTLGAPVLPPDTAPAPTTPVPEAEPAAVDEHAGEDALPAPIAPGSEPPPP